MAPGPDERLLRDVLRRTGVPGHREREAEDPTLEARDERRRCFAVAGRQPGEERIVGD